MILVRKKFKNNMKIVCAAERYVIVLIGKLLVIDVYLPSAGTVIASIYVRKFGLICYSG